MASRRQLRRQARQQGNQRYGPEQRALGLLEQDARRDFRDTRASSRTAADSIVGSAREGRQDIRGIYEDAGLTALVRGTLDSNPNARRIAEEMAEAETEMVNREVDAREGAAFAVRQARQQRDRTLTDIGRRRTSLAAEKGAFVSDLLGQLIGEQRADRAQAAADAQDRGIRMLNAGIDPTTGAPIPGGKLDPNSDGVLGGTKPKKPKKATGADRSASTALGKAGTWIKRIDNPEWHKKIGTKDIGRRRSALREILIAGEQSQGIPAVPQEIVEAALDMHFAGRLSPATVKMLRSLGIQVRRLPGVQLGPAPSSRPDTAGNPNVAGR